MKSILTNFVSILSMMTRLNSHTFTHTPCWMDDGFDDFLGVGCWFSWCACAAYKVGVVIHIYLFLLLLLSESGVVGWVGFRSFVRQQVCYTIFTWSKPVGYLLVQVPTQRVAVSVDENVGVAVSVEENVSVQVQSRTITSKIYSVFRP